MKETERLRLAFMQAFAFYRAAPSEAFWMRMRLARKSWLKALRT